MTKIFIRGIDKGIIYFYTFFYFGDCMRLRDIIRFLKLLGVGEVKISEEEEWVRCSCPLAPWTHVKGSDENPSFGIKVNDKGESGFHCFTCYSGRLLDLLHIMHFTIGVPITASDFFSLTEVFDEEAESKDWKTDELFPDHYIEDIIPEKKKPVPLAVLEQFPLLEYTEYEVEQIQIENYFINRGIRPDVLHEYDVRMQPVSSYIIFPIIDTDREVYRLHVKVLHSKGFFYVTPDLAGFPKMKPWGRKDYWFGMQFYDPTEPVILVESETDLLRLRSLGVSNILASCGPLNKFKADRIANKTIYLGFDADEAGSKFTMKAIQFFKGRELYKLPWEVVQHKWYTPKKRLERYRPCKDAGDLMSEEDFEEVMRRKIPLGSIPIEVNTFGFRDFYQ